MGGRSIFWLILALYPTYKPSDLIKIKSIQKAHYGVHAL